MVPLGRNLDLAGCRLELRSELLALDVVLEEENEYDDKDDDENDGDED